MLPSLVVRNDLQCYMYELHDEREVENFDEGVTRERGKIIPKDKIKQAIVFDVSGSPNNN